MFHLGFKRSMFWIVPFKISWICYKEEETKDCISIEKDEESKENGIGCIKNKDIANS